MEEGGLRDAQCDLYRLVAGLESCLSQKRRGAQCLVGSVREGGVKRCAVDGSWQSLNCDCTKSWERERVCVCVSACHVVGTDEKLL